MIAVNIMNIDLTALAADDSLIRAYEVFSEVEIEELPVLENEAVVFGVLSKKRLLKAMKKKDAEGPGLGSQVLTVAGLSERAFRSAGPGATQRELRDLLKCGEGKGGYVFIVDNARRLLGRVGEAELTRRAAEYEEYSERS